SARKPYPGWIIVALARRAASRIAPIDRYEVDARAGPMRKATSAISTCNASRSASEYTATVGIPSSRHVRMSRTAISPRLAIRILGFTATTGATIIHGRRRTDDGAGKDARDDRRGPATRTRARGGHGPRALARQRGLEQRGGGVVGRGERA